jgi:hypothetical protein
MFTEPGKKLSCLSLLKNPIVFGCFFFIHLLSLSSVSVAQELKENATRDRFFTGGNLGLQFGAATFIDISPLLGYKFTEKLHGGIGATYIYYKIKETAYNYDYETSIYGGRVFGRYYFMENLFAHTETEILNMDVPQAIGGPGSQYKLVRDNIVSVLAGGGYAQKIGDRSAFVMMILWNFKEEQFSP